MDSPLFTLAETAVLLRRHPKTLRRWHDAGYGVQPIALGRKLMYRAADIDAFLEGLSAEAGNQGL